LQRITKPWKKARGFLARIMKSEHALIFGFFPRVEIRKNPEKRDIR
jgi:hypothetical protein